MTRPFPLPLDVDGVTVCGDQLQLEVCGLVVRVSISGRLRTQLESAVGELRQGRRITAVVDLLRDGIRVTVPPVTFEKRLWWKNVMELRARQEDRWTRTAGEELAHAG